MRPAPSFSLDAPLLDDILRRMQMHQSKKRSLLRALRAWPVDDADD